MRDLYFALKRRVMRVRCLFGHHNYKMGVPARTGGGFGCLWCKKAMPRPFTYHRRSWSATNAPTNSQKSAETDPLLAEAERQVRRLFGGKA